MEFRKLIIVLSITITIIMGIMFGVSYGWYAYSNAETKMSGSTLKETPTIIFTQTEYITSTQNMPIYDEDRYNYANKNSFTITVGNNLKYHDVGIQISLKDLHMSNELKIASYKYELVQDGKTIANGDFSNIGAATILNMTPMIALKPNNYPQTYTFELYIWLSDDGTNQNELMNKVFSARVNVESATKRK